MQYRIEESTFKEGVYCMLGRCGTRNRESRSRNNGQRLARAESLRRRLNKIPIWIRKKIREKIHMRENAQSRLKPSAKNNALMSQGRA